VINKQIAVAIRFYIKGINSEYQKIIDEFLFREFNTKNNFEFIGIDGINEYII